MNKKIWRQVLPAPKSSLSINLGVVKGRLPLKLYSGSDGMHVRTDENL